MSMSQMNTSEIIQALTPLVEALERFGIKYCIGGSVASSVHGKRRYTQDVDVVAALQLKHVQTLVAMLQQAYYIDADMICDAIRNRSSFNLLHHDTGVKVDVFVQKPDPFAQQELRRAREEVLEVGSRPFFFASPPRYDSRQTRLVETRWRCLQPPVERHSGDDEGKACCVRYRLSSSICAHAGSSRCVGEGPQRCGSSNSLAGF
jgi:hypothetical protein